MTRTAGWISLRHKTKNLGNSFIDDATWALLDRPDRISASAFEPMIEREIVALSASNTVVLPGATLLDVGEHPIALGLERISAPKLALGVAFCATDARTNLAVAEAIGQPIGSRDPFTHERLLHAGLDSELVGCTTLTIGEAERWRDPTGYVVCSLGVGPQADLARCVKAIAHRHPVIIAEHAPSLQARFALDADVRWEAPDSLESIKALYAAAAAVVTGRIHGALPAIALGVRTLFFSDWRDSRYSLLDAMGVSVHPGQPDTLIGALDALLDARPSLEPLEKAAEFRQRMTRFVDRFW